MDTDALLHPRGPLPSGVYWRRRAVTVGAVVLVAALGLRACGSDDPTSLTAGTPSPTASPAGSAAPSSAAPGGAAPSAETSNPPVAASASPTASPARAAGQPCRDTDLVVTATASAKQFAAGQRPRLTLVVSNRATVSCTRDLGAAARELRVVSGADRVWSSDDCSPGGQADVVLLKPGESRTFPVTWSRTRSRPGCPAERPAAGAGTYRVIGRIGTVERPGDSFVLS